jgi:hypothetical protein
MGVAFATIDVDADAALQARYGDVVPVLLLGDEEIVAAPITEQGLRGALASAGVAFGRR